MNSLRWFVGWWAVLSLTLGLAVAQTELAQDTEEQPLLVVNVVDADAKPIPTAKVRALLTLNDVNYSLTSDFKWYGYHPVNARGRLVCDDNRLQMSYRDHLKRGLKVVLTLYVMAPGYVPVIKSFRDEFPKEITLTLQKGRPVDLFIYDALGKPVVLSEGESHYEANTQIVSEEARQLLFVIDGSPSEVPPFWEPSLDLIFGLEPIAEGHYRFYLPENFTAPVRLVFYEKALSGYDRIFTPEELQSGRLEVRLPPPTTVTVEIDLRAFIKERAMPNECTVYLGRRHGKNRGTSIRNHLMTTVAPSERVRVTFTNVAPGDWTVYCRMGRHDEQFAVNVPQAPEAQFRFAVVPEDIKQYRGKRTLSLQVLRTSGAPYANQPYRVEFVSPKSYQAIPVASGRLDSQGRATLKNLYEHKSTAQIQTAYVVYVGTQRVGEFVLVEGDGRRQVQIMMPPMPGEPAPNTTLTVLSTGQNLQLRQFRGKWVYLEFWATWCGPCQAALQELKQVLEKHGEQWKGRLQVITVSVDESIDGVQAHLERQGLGTLAIHTWDDLRRKDSAYRLYAVQYIPTAYLIDPQGKVIWSGNPLQQIEFLLTRYLGR
ncbi:MAG: TlpA disulfide reductase family protein [Fimbriimonadales bacterium]